MWQFFFLLSFQFELEVQAEERKKKKEKKGALPSGVGGYDLCRSVVPPAYVDQTESCFSFLSQKEHFVVGIFLFTSVMICQDLKGMCVLCSNM